MRRSWKVPTSLGWIDLSIGAGGAGAHSRNLPLGLERAIAEWVQRGEFAGELGDLYETLIPGFALRTQTGGFPSAQSLLLSRILDAVRAGDLVVGAPAAPARRMGGAVPKKGKEDPPPPPPPPPPPDDAVFGITRISMVPVFAPSAETIQIDYEINDAKAKISSAVFEVLRKGETDPFFSKPLAPGDFTNGPHKMPWNGEVTLNSEFPDGFVSLEFSPYTVRIRVAGAGVATPEKQETTFEVKLIKFEVQLGEKDVLKTDNDKTVHGQVGTLPAKSKVDLHLVSNLFSVNNTDMYDATAFESMRKLWDDGPRIPIIATVWIQDSAGNALRCGKALGRTRVLFDFTDPAESKASYKVPTARAFVDKARNHESAKAKPETGDNNHSEFGGKRAADAGHVLSVFKPADSDTQNFPYSLQDPKKRFWASYGFMEKKGDGEARAGAFFRASRFAGDNYEVTAYLDRFDKLDTTDKVPSGELAKVKVGAFEVFRDVHLAEYFKKSSATAPMTPAIDDVYADSYTTIVNKTGAPKVIAKADYDAMFAQARTTAWKNNAYTALDQFALPSGSAYDSSEGPGILGKIVDFIKDVIQAVEEFFGAAPAPPAPGAPATEWVATVRSYSDFKDSLKSSNGWNDAQLNAFLTTNDLATEERYSRGLSGYLGGVAVEMCKALCKKEGVTILQFSWTHSLEPTAFNSMAGAIRLEGMACFFKRECTGFVFMQPIQQTFAHELGHCLFLPHAPQTSSPTNPVGGAAPDRHDGGEQHCYMSYNPPFLGFCGLCLLRLRGYDQSKFDKNGLHLPAVGTPPPPPPEGFDLE